MARDPDLLAECRALRAAVASYPTLGSLRSAPQWPDLERRFARLLDSVRVLEPAEPPAPPADPARVRAVQWNIEHGSEIGRVEQALRAHRDLRDADLVLLEEVDLGLARSGNRDVAADLAAALGLHAAQGWLFLETLTGRDDEAGHARGREDEEGLFGIAILSRWPLREARVVALPGPERLQFEVERMVGRHVGLVVTVERPGAPFVAVATHLEVHRTRRHRATQMRALLAALADERRPVVLAGDLNTHTFDRGRWDATLRGAQALMLERGQRLERRFLHPDEGPWHEPLFDELRAAGFAWEPFVDRQPTLRLRFDRLREAQLLFGPARGPATRLLAWAEHRGRLKLDWLAGRDWSGGRGHTVRGLDGPGGASDHAPIVAEFR
jgi:endonuclease/exonuclease/phosphatase family metal-dependent hydrolase